MLTDEPLDVPPGPKEAPSHATSDDPVQLKPEPGLLPQATSAATTLDPLSWSQLDLPLADPPTKAAAPIGAEDTGLEQGTLDDETARRALVDSTPSEPMRKPPSSHRRSLPTSLANVTTTCVSPTSFAVASYSCGKLTRML